MDPLKLPAHDDVEKAVARAHRLPRWQRTTLYVTGVVLVLSGCLWLVLHYSAGAEGLPSPLEAWSLRAHGLAAFAGLFAMGTLAAAHVPHGWRLTRHRSQGQRLTGMWLCVLSALLALTGYALYYFAPESIRPALGWSHAMIGLLMAILLLSHRRGAS